jgi:hypothetical protein
MPRHRLLPGILLLSFGLLVLVPRWLTAQTPPEPRVFAALARWPRKNSHGVTDRQTVRGPSEVTDQTLEGQLFYVPAFGVAGRHALYRLHNATTDDSMDSLSQTEGGYGNATLLGYLFDTQVAGTAEVRRWRNKSTGDGATAFDAENLAPAGYAKDQLLGYAYPRFGNECEETATVRGSQVTLSVNAVAGGVVSGLLWNGKQFINKYDFGRNIQTAINLSGQPERYNPTEAGDVYGCPGVAAAAWAHGSPLLSSSVRNRTLQTQAAPLFWHPQDFGGDGDRPAIWPGRIAKQVDLDFGGSPNVIRWVTTVTFPNSESYVDMEIITAYLNSEFTQFYAYDARTSAAPFAMSPPSGGCIDPSFDPPHLEPVAGGVVIATGDRNYALGIYRRGTTSNPVLFGLCKFLGNGGIGEYGYQTTKWNALYRPAGGLAAGSYSLTSYLLVGTLDKVVSEARRLYQSGV